MDKKTISIMHHWRRGMRIVKCFGALWSLAPVIYGGSVSTGADVLCRDFLYPNIRNEINVHEFGARGDGVADDTTSIRAAISAARGRLVYFPAGIYKITRSITSGVDATQIRLCGSGPAKYSHGILNFAFNNVHDYSPRSLTLSSSDAWGSVIHAVGCSIVGGDDGPRDGTEHRLKYFGNLFCYGDGSSIALNISPQDCIIENAGFALFGRFGILIRGGITSRFANLSFQDCGWALPGSMIQGDRSSYYSGCAIKIVANDIPGDYRTIKPGFRPTTMMFDSIFINVRKDTGLNESGMRALQCAGAIGFNFQSVQGYSGMLMVNSQIALSGLYVENYDFNGFYASDHTPICLATIGCAISSDEPYMANMEVRGAAVSYSLPGHGSSSYNAVTATDGVGFRTDGAIRAGRSEVIVANVGSGGREYKLMPWALRKGEGFTGIAYITLVNRLHPAQYAMAEFAIHWHAAGGQVFVSPCARIAGFESSESEGKVSGLTVNELGGVTLSVLWRNSDGGKWDAGVGLVGAGFPPP